MLKLINAMQNGEDRYELYEMDLYKVEVSYYGRYKNIYVSKKERSYYIPEIYFENGVIGKEEFKIQTTSYGTLDVPEIEKVIEGYKLAIEAAKELTERFCR